MIQSKSTPDEPEPIFNVLSELPLFDNVFLSMQLQNISMIDSWLWAFETKVRYEFYLNGELNLPEFFHLSAFSQMWTFATYELLRTWRQYAESIIALDNRLRPHRGQPTFSQAVQAERVRRRAAPRSVSQPHVNDAFYEDAYREVEKSPTYAANLRSHLKKVNAVLRRLTDVRVALAKHEVALGGGGGRNVQPMRAFMPGYARMDHVTGSVTWMVDLKDNSTMMVGRRDLADAVRTLAS